MSKDINDLVPDIYQLLTSVVEGTTHEISDDDLAELGGAIAMHVRNTLTAQKEGVRKGVLRVSNLGKPCKRQLWYDYNLPQAREKLPPNVLIKFLYGNIIEELILFLAKQAGHEVTDEQGQVEKDLKNGWKVKGSMDAKIDNVVVDVKSASSYAFKKFKEGTLRDDDPFGYIQQVVAYDELGSAQEGPDSLPGILAMDKQTGSLTLLRLTGMDYHKGHATGLGEAPLTSTRMDMPIEPVRAFKPQPHQTSGNEKLGVNCSYCAYKEECWKDSNDGKGLRTFMYSNKPIFLTKVVKEPRVPEVIKEKS